MLQDSIAPAGPGDRYAGFHKLWLRVIQRAIFDWVSWRDSTKLDKRKAAEMAGDWLFKPNTLFNSFDNVCQMLDVDPQIIRRKALTITKDDVLKAEHIERSGRRTEPVEAREKTDGWTPLKPRVPVLLLSEG